MKRLHMITLGDFTDPHSLSGWPYNLYKALSARGDVDLSASSANLFGIQVWKNRIVAFSPNISAWRERSYKNRYCFNATSKNAGLSLAKMRDVDYILQLQTMFSLPTSMEVPYGVYTDYTIALAKKEYSPWAPFRNDAGYSWWFEAEKRVFTNAKHVFTFSEPARQSIIDDYKINADKVISVKSGTPFPVLAQRKDKGTVKRFLCVGKDYERKGIEYLLFAFERLRKTHSDVSLVIIGCKLPKEFDGVRNIVFMEDREALLGMYRESDVFVMPSVAEPFGYTYVEAMSVGLPWRRWRYYYKR